MSETTMFITAYVAPKGDPLGHPSDGVFVPMTNPRPNSKMNVLTRGTGRVFPARFIPPSTSITPSQLFTGRKTHLMVTRYTLPNDKGTVLVRTDGACLNNGQANPKAGWAFLHGEDPTGRLLTGAGRLELKGPFGDDSHQTSNRAELRAAIAALRFRFWPGEGFHTFVLATDSEYVVEGGTKWVRSWTKNGWKTSNGNSVKNQDLWETLLGECERYKEKGMAIKFWRIPREWNVVADEAAKAVAAKDCDFITAVDLSGVSVWETGPDGDTFCGLVINPSLGTVVDPSIKG